MMLGSELMRFTNAVNMAGLPAISLPIPSAGMHAGSHALLRAVVLALY